jgi:hypothetical protein
MTMRSFTPQRWLRLQDTSNRTAWSTAFVDWEQAVRDYDEVVKRLAANASDLRPFLQAESLHNGSVLAYGFRGQAKDQFFLLVRPCWPGDQLVLLSYQLIAPPTVRTQVLPSEWCDERSDWMYDEVGLDDNSAVFTHDILLSNGMELALRFRGFTFTPLSVDVASLAPRVEESPTGAAGNAF